MVDDDRDVRVAISFMLNASNFVARPFAGGADLLENIRHLEPGAILLDIRMPGMDGFQVMDALLQREIDWPVIVMTGHGEVSIAVRAMKMGAVDFLEKPFGEEVVLAALKRAFAALSERAEKSDRQRESKARIAGLSPREIEVLRGLLAGLPNKVLARRLDISLRTVEMHRANMMSRLEVTSLAAALMLAVSAGLEPLSSVVDDELDQAL